jgi:probable HAF family extracellular repeat protein
MCVESIPRNEPEVEPPPNAELPVAPASVSFCRSTDSERTGPMEIIDLGTLAERGVSEATDLNGRGVVVGWSGTTVEGAQFIRAVQWEDDEPTALEPLREDGLGDTEAAAINARGTVVGSAQGSDWGWNAVRWVDDELELLGPSKRSQGRDHAACESSQSEDESDETPGNDRPADLQSGDSRALDVNARGTVVGHRDAIDSEVRAFRWTKRDGMVSLGTLRADGAGQSVATAVDDDGTVVGRSVADDGRTHAFRWTKREGMTDLGTLPGDEAGAAFDVESGAIVGWSSRADEFATRTATRWDGETRDSIGTFRVDDTGYSQAYGVVGDVVVGASQVDAGGSHAFAWADDRLFDLGTLRDDDTGQSSAVAANARGSVVGWSQVEDGANHAVRWIR